MLTGDTGTSSAIRGLLVPCRDRNGYIQGLQIRLDDETKPDRKYRWLSSRGKAHGTRSYSYIHVTGNIHARTAYLTEGGLKGDVAASWITTRSFSALLA